MASVRSKDDIEEIARLKTALTVLKERFDQMCPHLVDDERKRAAQLWEAAQYAHYKADPGQPGPIAVIARGLRDTEERMLQLSNAADQSMEIPPNETETRVHPDDEDDPTRRRPGDE